MSVFKKLATIFIDNIPVRTNLKPIQNNEDSENKEPALVFFEKRNCIYTNTYSFYFDPIFNNHKNMENFNNKELENEINTIVNSSVPSDEFFNKNAYDKHISNINLIQNKYFKYDDIIEIYDYVGLNILIEECENERNNIKKINPTLIYALPILYDIKNEIINNYYRYIKIGLMSNLMEKSEINICYYDHLSVFETFSQKLKELEIIKNFYTHTNQRITYDNTKKIVEIKMFYVDYNEFDHLFYNIQFVENR